MMTLVNAPSLITILINLQMNSQNIMSYGASVEDRAHLKETLDALLKETERLAVKPSFGEQVQRLQERAANANVSAEVLRELIFELHSNLIFELTAYAFLAIPPLRKPPFVDTRTWFGERSIDRFSWAARDIRDACQCFALAQWTACVFHSMRVLEHGLRTLALDLLVAFPISIDVESWGSIIDKIESKITDLEKTMPKSADKPELLKFYSQAATEFRHFKDAWRNHVSHTKESYDEQGAKRVLEHVRDFMAHLATRLRQVAGAP